MDTVYFDVTIPPAIPLHVGQRIRIKLLRERTEDDGERGQARGPTKYWSESTNIEGTITAVRTMELAITEFVVRNEDRRSLTEFAYLATPHAEGETVRFEIWRRVARTLLLPLLLHTRQIKIERNADVRPRTYSIWRDERPMEDSESEDEPPAYDG